jgi:hypothetical protein
MLLRTHYIFTSGLLSLLSNIILPKHFELVIASVIVAVASNTIIDKLGHEIRGGIPRRSPLTHTPLRSIFWGILPGIPIIIFLNNYIFLIPCLFSGPSHLFLDIFTEKGIYVRRNNRWKRFYISRFRYDNKVLNGIASTLGIIMLYLSLQI